MRKYLFIPALSFLVLASATLAVLALQPKIGVGFAVKALAAVVAVTTDSTIDIRGKYYVIPGKWLQVSCEEGEAEIATSTGLKVHLTVGTMATSVHVPGLLSGDLLLDTISVRNLDIDMVRGKQTGNSTINRQPGTEADGFSPGLALKQTGRIDGRDIVMRIGTEEDEAPLELQIASLTGNLKQTSPGEVQIKGSLASRSFEASLTTGPLGSFEPESPLSFQTRLLFGVSVAEFDGYLAHDGKKFNLNSEFSVEGKQFDDIAALLGYRPQEHIPFSLGGRLLVSPDEKTLEVNRLHPGTANAVFSAALEKVSRNKPSISIKAEGDLIDADILLSVFAPESQPEPVPHMKGNGQDFFINEHIAAADLNLGAEIKKLVIGRKQINDITFHSVMKNGVIRDAPFAATLADIPINGKYSIDAGRTPPALSARFTAGPCNVGKILKNNGFAEGLELTVNEIDSSLKTTGWKASELAGNLEFTINARGGSLILSDSNTGKGFPVEIIHSFVSAQPDGKMVFELDSSAHAAPLTISSEFDIGKMLSGKKEGDIPFSMKVAYGDSTLELDGRLPVPFSPVGTSVNVDLSGKDISSFNNILGIEIPVVGNYQIGGGFQVVSEGYELSIKHALIGNSVFKGHLNLNTETSPPELSLHLKAERIQLGDIDKTRVLPDSVPDTPPAPAAGATEHLKHYTDQTILDSFNALISVEADAVFSGSDYMGNGSIRILQKNGSITISPIRISSPDGIIDARFSIEPFESERLYTIDIDVKDLDYGTVSRWFKPETDQGGTLSLRASLEARAKPDEAIMPKANGYIDFFVQPVNFTAGVIDLWAVNLISYLTPVFAPTKESRLHCIAGRLIVQDGKMKHEEILADTSRIQVRGTLEVDFARKWIESQLRPIPKRPQFYSLATPVNVSGRLENLKVGVARGGIIGTIIRVATSYIVVPVQWIIFNKVPRDGTEQCLQVFNARTQ